MKKSEIVFGLLRIPTDFVMTLLGFLAAYKLRTFTHIIPGIELPLDITTFPELSKYYQFANIAAILLIALFAGNEMYQLKTTSKFTRESKKTIIVSAAWFMLLIGYFFLTRSFPFSRLALLYSWILTAIFIIIGRGTIRAVQYYLLKKGIGRRRVAVIGESNFSKDITKTILENPRYELVGFITQHRQEKNMFLGTIEDLEKIIEKKHIEEIIQAESNLDTMKDAQIVKFCRENHVTYSFVPDLLQIQRTNLEISAIGKIPLITLKPTPLDGWGRVWKRATDIIGSLIGLTITAPILFIAAIAIKIDSKGPVFFSKDDNGKTIKRMGQYGKLFLCHKLRTMYPGTHARRYSDLEEKNIRKNSPLVKIKDDPRVTRVGKFLRRSSLDELPQLWNVLKGEMSLVGPRPHFPEEIAKYDKEQKFVLALKPGITGLAQINGRSDLDFAKEIQLDTYYIQNWTPFLDLKIILKTFGVVVKGYKE